MRIGRLLLVLAVPLLIVACEKVACGQDPKPPTIEGVKKVVCHVQSTEGTDMVRGVPNGKRAWKSDIYVQDGPKTKPRLLAQGGEAPQWSPNGERVAFLGFSTVSEFNTVVLGGLASRQIQVMNADGSGTKQVTKVPNGIWDFAWSPVEQKIAYCELDNDGRTAIVILNADGSGRTEVTKMGEARCAVGMPVLNKTLDRLKSLYSTHLYGGKASVSLVGGHESDAAQVIKSEVIGLPTLAWSPEGSRLAFTSVVNGKIVIGVVGINGGNPKPIIMGYSPQWSPDGKQLLFRHDSEKAPSVTSICIANADGTQPRKVLDGESADFGLIWFPDGKSIVFASKRENKNQSEIFRINADGTGLAKIATQDHSSLSSPAVSPDGTELIVDANPSDGSRSYTYGPGIWIVDLANHRQEVLMKGSQASVLWEKK
jgi:Tol biopolymer transport system component